MSNTDILRTSEADLLPPRFLQDHVFDFTVEGYRGRAEVDGWHPESQEAVEVYQSDCPEGVPKPGQKRKLASDVLKLIFLLDKGLISRGRVFVTSDDLYTWFHQTEGSWLSASCRHYGIRVELKQHRKKMLRKRIRNVMRQASTEMKHPR